MSVPQHLNHLPCHCADCVCLGVCSLAVPSSLCNRLWNAIHETLYGKKAMNNCQHNSSCGGRYVPAQANVPTYPRFCVTRFVWYVCGRCNLLWIRRGAAKSDEQEPTSKNKRDKRPIHEMLEFVPMLPQWYIHPDPSKQMNGVYTLVGRANLK